MAVSTALSRERAEECALRAWQKLYCSNGFTARNDTSNPVVQFVTVVADLYEELAKERDELLGDKEIVDWITTASCKPAICKCGGKFSLYDPQRITGWYDNPRDAWREFLRTAREKENDA